MRTPPELCDHPVLVFGSGDYYVTCRDCWASWVMTKPGTDESCPQRSNLSDLQRHMSDTVRVKPVPQPERVE